MDAAKALSVWSAIGVAALAVTIMATLFVVLYSRRMVAESDARIAQADARTAEAHARATGTAEDQHKLHAEVEQARLMQRGLEQENLSLQSQLQQNRIARRPLEEPAVPRQNSVPRRISNEQAVIIISAIRPFAGFEVSVSRLLGDAEASQYATQLLAILRSAGWKPQTNFAPTMSPTPYGVVYQATDPGSIPEPVAALLEALKASDVPVTVGPGRGSLLVGLQPPSR